MFNFKSPSFKELGVKAESLNEDKLIELMLKEPRLIPARGVIEENPIRPSRVLHKSINQILNQ